MFIRHFVSNPNPGINLALLDDVPQSAAAAYGLRLLKSDYAGACCTVKRLAGDNTTIGFVPDGLGDMVVDEAAIKAFCGATIGTIRILFDQSGNGNDLNGGGTPSSPIIYDGVNIVKVGGKPAMDFGVGVDRSIDDLGRNIPIIDATVLMKFSTLATDNDSRRVFALSESTFTDGSLICVARDTGAVTFSVRYPTPQVSISTSALPLGQHTYFASKKGTNFIGVGVNGGALATNINPQSNLTINTLRLGGNEAKTLGGSFNGLIQEFVLWDNDAAPSRNIMESNLDRFY